MLYHMGYRQPAQLPNIMCGMLGTFIVILVIKCEKYSLGGHTCHQVLHSAHASWWWWWGDHWQGLTVDKYFNYLTLINYKHDLPNNSIIMPYMNDNKVMITLVMAAY